MDSERFLSVYCRLFPFIRRRFMNLSSSTQSTNLFFQDPCQNLRQFLEVPLFDDNEKPFEPSREEMNEALQLFKPRRNHEILRLPSFHHFDELPKQNIPEVVFIGRSNVGKSSLLETMLSNVPSVKVKTSKKPGFTKKLSFFAIGRSLFLVDAPGYGFNQPKRFVESVETYLRQRKSLVRTFLLVDGKVGFTELDYVALEMIEEFQIPYALVLTKVDKATSSRRLVNLMDVKKIRNQFSSPSCFVQPFMVSAHTGEGMGHLMAFIAYITGNLVLKNG